jgi:SAM-dependent methyltransferase
MKIINRNRWQIAQNGEEEYWNKVMECPEEFLRILHEKYLFLEKVKSFIPSALNPPESGGKALEIGVGPLGIGVASLLEPFDRWEVDGIDPLPRKKRVNLPIYLSACFDELMKRPLNYIQMVAEDFTFSKDKYNIVICYNVLDHTSNPIKIINNIYNLLLPGGYFLLGLDTLSLISKFRQKIFFKKYYDKSHPYKFTVYGMRKIIQSVPFEIVWFEKGPSEIYHRFCAKARRLTAICRKPTVK